MSETKPRLGFIGLGLMGSAMAERLLQDGYELSVWNLEPEPVTAFVEKGAKAAASPAAVAAASDIVLLCVLDTPAVEAVVFGPEGVAAAGQGATLLVDHSTAMPLPTAEMARRLRAEAGIEWLDAPVSGGPSFALKKQLTIMAGGAPEVFKRVKPILKTYAGNITLMGPAGAGQMAKVINQAISGVSYVLMAEVLRLAEASGIDAARIPQCLHGGHADSTMLHFAYPRMLKRKFEPPLSRTKQMLKDLHAVEAEAARLSLELPLIGMAADRFEAYAEAGGEAADTSSIYRLYSEKG